VKKYFVAAMLLVILSFAVYAFAASTDTQTAPVRTCPQCGMNAAKSPIEIKYGEIYFVSLDCWSEYATANEVDLSKASVVDYPTTTAKTRKYVELTKAFFVSVEKMKNTMPPYYAAFSNEDAAKSFAEENKSTVIHYAELSAVLTDRQDDTCEGSGDCCGSGADADNGSCEHSDSGSSSHMNMNMDNCKGMSDCKRT
jgi:hypothetical protein